jgi:DNA-binding MarR family transcriptional regulator
VKQQPTERQLAIAEAMLRYHDAHGEWPSQREIADQMGLKSTNMSPYFGALIKKGIAEKIPDRGRRNVALTEKGESLIREGWQPSLL